MRDRVLQNYDVYVDTRFVRTILGTSVDVYDLLRLYLSGAKSSATVVNRDTGQTTMLAKARTNTEREMIV